MSFKTLIYKNFIWRGFFYFTYLLLNIAMARVLGAELSGGLYFLLNNLYLAILIGSISLDAGITYFVSRGELNENKLASVSFLWAFIVSLLISVSFLVLQIEVPVFFKNGFLFFACISFSVGTFLSGYFNAFFYSKDDYKTPNLIAGVTNLLLLICIPWKNDWLGFINDDTFLLIFFIEALMRGIVISIAWFRKKGNAFSFRIFPLNDISPAVKYSLAAITGNIIYFVLYRIDYWFVESYCLPKSLGNYIQVSRLGQLLIIPSTIIAGTLFPQSSKKNVSFNSPSFKKLFWLIVILYSLIGLAVLFAGKPLISIFWGVEYDEMYEPLLLTMPGILFLAVSYLFSPIFAGTNKVKLNVGISFCSMIVVIVCNILLVPVYGIKGAAMATTAGFASMMILYFLAVKFKFAFSVLTLIKNNLEE